MFQQCWTNEVTCIPDYLAKALFYELIHFEYASATLKKNISFDLIGMQCRICSVYFCIPTLSHKHFPAEIQ